MHLSQEFSRQESRELGLSLIFCNFALRPDAPPRAVRKPALLSEQVQLKK